MQVTGSGLTPTSISVNANPNSVAPGGSILFTAAVTPNHPAPGGTVQFIVDGQNVGALQTVLADGSASLQTTTGGLAAGPHALTATYSGDAANYRSSNAPPASFVITSPGTPTQVNFVATPTTLVRGTSVSVAVTVTTTGSAATGTVQLLLDGSLYGTQSTLANGSANLQLVTRTLQVGTHLLDVFYSGDSSHGSLYGIPVKLIITAPGNTPSSVNILNLAPVVPLGIDVDFTASITPSNPVPTGILQITLDSGTPGAPILLQGADTPLSIPLPASPRARTPSASSTPATTPTTSPPRRPSPSTLSRSTSL